MASPLQKAPIGLLGAFDLKTIGRNPNIFSDTVVPMAEVLDLYAPPTRVEALVASVNADAATTIVSVPDGTAWLVHTITAQWVIGAAATVTTPRVGVVVAVAPPGQDAAWLAERSFDASGLPTPVGANVRAFASWSGRLLCPPGTQLIGATVGSLDVAQQLNVRVLFAPLQV